MTTTKLTAAQTAALRYLAAYADEGHAAADALPVRFPRADVQARLVALGLATDDDEFGGLVTITDAGRIAAGLPVEAPAREYLPEATAPAGTGSGAYVPDEDEVEAIAARYGVPADALRAEGDRMMRERAAALDAMPTDDEPAEPVVTVEPATVERYRTPSGNRDEDRFRAVHPACGWRSLAWYSNRTVEGRRLAERDAREHRCPEVEADVPPTAEERVTVRIRARELRAGDEVVDSLGERQYAAFDTDAPGTPGNSQQVLVWTAIRDQERGLPPVIRLRPERELLVLRPVSDEGRELLAALDRS